MSQLTIAHLGAQHRLGNHQATYKPATTCSVIVGFIFFLIGCVVTLGSLLVVSSAGPFLLLFTAFGLLCAGVALHFVISAYQNRMMRVFVYDHGLIHRGRKSQQTICWQQIQAVWHQVKEHTSTDSDGRSTTTYIHTYIVNCVDGTTLQLDNTFARLRHLGRSVERATVPYLYPGILMAYQRNLPIVFGPLTLTPLGLQYQAKMLPWTEMKSIKVYEDTGHIGIKKQGKLFLWATIALGDLPNVEVFRMLVQHITSVRP